MSTHKQSNRLAILVVGLVALTTVGCRDISGYITPETVAAFNQASRQNLQPVQVNQLCDQIDAAQGAGTCAKLATATIANQKPGLVEKPYRAFTTCTQAVDYLFEGRWDQSRAIRVVKRESGNQPGARRPGSQYAGCTQISAGMRKNLLGPWNDPYYNVLVMYQKASNGGWCHWDIVNYCRAGGEW